MTLQNRAKWASKFVYILADAPLKQPNRNRVHPGCCFEQNMERLLTIGNHLSKPMEVGLKHTRAFSEHDDDVVIVSALRTPICKSKRGSLKVRTVLQVTFYR